ncbi:MULTISPECIES: NAD(P)/FAD-dependent oxidoreductase [unclassified Schlesneria]|uniref:NAD(P)/FAD-dependent oxidoreductase n=1 Tax=unclassified Schlesneria TaxID=2762017 RepID=UPI002EEE06FA
MVNSTEPRVIVIGGGPSGSTAATLIAQRGHKVRLLEREQFPRFHIGESLIPQTYWVLKRLNMLDKMKSSEFIRKYSVQFVGASGRLSEPFYFLDHKPHESSQTWQVRRSEFDQMMLQNAADHGVDVQQGVRVLEVLFEGERAVGVRVKDEAGGEERIERADVIVDASGQSSLIMGKLGLREWDQELKKAAVWTYWEGAQRDTGRDEGATVVLQVQGKTGWFWYIPLHDNIISVGVVADHNYLFKNRDTKDFEAIYHAEVEKCPAVKQRISLGKRVAPYRAAKEYSYRSRRAAGDGWVLVGDAFGFLDPLYSSGVLLALKSGELAADAVCEGLAKGDTSAAQLGAWEPDYVRGMQRMRSLVNAYYAGFSFGRFVAKHPNRKGDITDLLIGDLFRPELDETLALVEEALKTPAMAEHK